MKINSFDVLKEMSSRNLDIRMSAACDNLVNVRKVRAGGEVTIGVDQTTCTDFMNFAMGIKKHNAVLLIFNMDQFREIQKELEIQQ